jgi:hypothetical protein
MKQITKELWEKAAQAESDDSWKGQQRFIERLVDLTVDECCSKLIDMQYNARGMHNYYGHAALQLKQHFKDKV